MSASHSLTLFEGWDTIEAHDDDLTALSERELLTELAATEDRLRVRLADREEGGSDTRQERTLLHLLLRERAISRQLQAVRLVPRPTLRRIT